MRAAEAASKIHNNDNELSVNTGEIAGTIVGCIVGFILMSILPSTATIEHSLIAFSHSSFILFHCFQIDNISDKTYNKVGSLEICFIRNNQFLLLK